MKKILALTFILSLIQFSSNYAQLDLNDPAIRIDHILKRIDRKIRLDKDYLDIYIIKADKEVFKDTKLRYLRTAKGDTLDLYGATGGQITYTIGFLKAGTALDSMVLLYIDKTTRDTSAATGGGLGRGGGGAVEVTERIYFFRDLYYLKKLEYEKYKRLYAYVNDYIEAKEMEALRNEKATVSEPKSTLGIKPDDEVKAKEGLSSRDNTDYLNYHRTNNYHKYPIYPKDEGGARRKGGGGGTLVNPLNIDFNFATLTIAHEKLDFGPGLASFHFSTEDRVLNLLPIQSNQLHMGFRFLISSNGDLTNMKDQFVLDAKVLARLGLAGSSIMSAFPMLMADKPKINIKSGFGMELMGTRPFVNAPFINIYFSTGTPDFTNPSIKFGRNDSSWAYWSTAQWEMSLSFFWNTNLDKEGRFKADVGIGNYDITKASYFGGIIVPQKKKGLFVKMQPLFSITYNTVLKEKDGTYSEKFGGSARWFDSRIKIYFWFKLLEYRPDHMIRFETTIISAPVFRKINPWETEGGVMFQIRYRYGFPVLSTVND